MPVQPIPVFDISTHTPLAGRDGLMDGRKAVMMLFLLTRPSRDVTEVLYPDIEFYAISTHTPLAGRD